MGLSTSRNTSKVVISRLPDGGPIINCSLFNDYGTGYAGYGQSCCTCAAYQGKAKIDSICAPAILSFALSVYLSLSHGLSLFLSLSLPFSFPPLALRGDISHPSEGTCGPCTCRTSVAQPLIASPLPPDLYALNESGKGADLFCMTARPDPATGRFHFACEELCYIKPIDGLFDNDGLR